MEKIINGFLVHTYFGDVFCSSLAEATEVSARALEGFMLNGVTRYNTPQELIQPISFSADKCPHLGYTNLGLNNHKCTACGAIGSCSATGRIFWNHGVQYTF